MKFWQLTSICRECPHLLESILENAEWTDFQENLLRIDELVELQCREELDKVVPEQLARAVLGEHAGRLYLSGAFLRVRRIDEADKELTFLDVYERFGGGVLEDTLEYGLVKLQ